MNERIRELALQAGCKVMDDGEWYIPTAKGLEKVVYTSGIGLEKFAELIVTECINIAYGYDKPKLSGPGLAIAGNIESHFDIHIEEDGRFVK